jgi:hypothetical protein
MKFIRKRINKFWSYIFYRIKDAEIREKLERPVKFKVFNDNWKRVEQQINKWLPGKVVINTIQTKASEDQYITIGIWYEEK